MKKLFFVSLILVCLIACSPIRLDPGGPATEELTENADCYSEGVHPAAQSIADEYSEITDYYQIMIWFCNGAEFEDIMNALLTEEISDSDAEILLRRIAEGETWNDIWLALDIVEE